MIVDAAVNAHDTQEHKDNESRAASSPPTRPARGIAQGPSNSLSSGKIMCAPRQLRRVDRDHRRDDTHVQWSLQLALELGALPGDGS